MFRAQERYMIILGAPTSIAQRQGEDTLTYLNKGREREKEMRQIMSRGREMVHLHVHVLLIAAGNFGHNIN